MEQMDRELQEGIEPQQIKLHGNFGYQVERAAPKRKPAKPF